MTLETGAPFQPLWKRLMPLEKSTTLNLAKYERDMIIKGENKYQVQSKSGKNLGEYKTLKEAKKRLVQVEMFKNLKKK
jgi:hypothetical protein